MPRVTALRDARGRVGVELDGAPWRTLPEDVVVRAGLRVGRDLDRRALREVSRELRRATALGVATRALRHRDLSRAELARRFDTAGVGSSAGAAALVALEAAGLVDDDRTATTRAESLAGRGYGDEAIRYDLERRGYAPQSVAAAVGRLAPEADRAYAVVARRGASAATARRLAARGFGRDVIEDVLSAAVAEDAGGAVR